ncbi:hypothetical protein B0J15DRAFT_465015 [Fusarium solani]|uniref:Uncharacterized protein n=1 Tax=Fusarium solani TaxID=169388 RepID=A0A9P9HMJ1_FUSSL|nr:uncharacterized protein B0J15DRAFT_465015 [Fusarium solani]KAH7260290.1 hypothetical protein B0J15DRAFT_465015 [Fusarium solani]
MAPVSLWYGYGAYDQEHQHPGSLRELPSLAPVNNSFTGSIASLNGTSRIHPIVKVNAVFSRGTTALHRRNASSGTVGIAVGLTLLAIIIISGLFYCAWENTKAEKRRKMKEKEKEKRKHGHRHGTHLRGGRRRHSKKRHHVHNHGEHHDYFANLYIPEQHHEKHYHKCKGPHHGHRHCRHKHAHDRHERKLWKRHHRCHHKHNDPPSPIIIDDWAPQRPEPMLQSPIAFVPKYDGLLMNEMDAPQIGRDFQVGDGFPQCGKGVDGIVCPRHGVVRDDRK